jgi:tRNA pseudouridine32 synthase/23S rRNA pseudouridine746 synthase
LYRDGLMLVVDKPAGVPVHRGPKGGPSLEDYFDELRFGLPRAPALAHRLDKDTSGCLVLGRHRKALERLGNLFKHGRIEKTYWAIVEGAPETDEGHIDMPLARLDAARGWWMRPDPLGLPAQTGWRVLGRGRDAQGGEISFLELTPHTGRTHQLRVHCQASGWPILGDPIYGHGRKAGAPPLHLHARSVIVPLQEKKDKVAVAAPAPQHMLAALRACGWRGESGAP